MKVVLYCLIVMCAITMATVKSEPDHNEHNRRAFLPTRRSSTRHGPPLILTARCRRDILPDPDPQNPAHKHGSPPTNPDRYRRQSLCGQKRPPAGQSQYEQKRPPAGF